MVLLFHRDWWKLSWSLSQASPNKCKTLLSKNQTSGKGKKGKPKMKKGDNDEGMDVVVAQQAIDDASSPDSCDVLMGGYETERHLVSWFTSVKISVLVFLRHFDCSGVVPCNELLLFHCSHWINVGIPLGFPDGDCQCPLIHWCLFVVVHYCFELCLLLWDRQSWS